MYPYCPSFFKEEGGSSQSTRAPFEEDVSLEFWLRGLLKARVYITNHYWGSKHSTKKLGLFPHS